MKHYQTPIESIVSCSCILHDDRNNILTIYGDIYTVYSPPIDGYRYRSVLETSDDDFPDCQRIKTGMPVYGWEIVDKDGNKLKTYCTRHKVTDDYFSQKPEGIRYLPVNYSNLRVFKKLFYDRVCANMKTYEDMGFYMCTNDPEDIKADLKTMKYRIAFSHNDTGKMITRDRYIYPRENESIKDIMVKTLCSDYTCSCPDSSETMLDNLEYMLNGKYVGVYKA